MAVEVDDSAFADDNEVIVVQGSQVEQITSALEAAAGRFMSVTDEGVEYTPEQFDELIEQGIEDEAYTPNYVAAPSVGPDGVEMYVDCKGQISGPMRSKFLDVLVDELERARVTDARLLSR